MDSWIVSESGCYVFVGQYQGRRSSQSFLLESRSLESICFAIAIGISCDFVIHFAHAYSTLDGDVIRGDRTQYALIRMGPSILAAAFTTICSAVVMIFTTITFFQKFAIILFFTILMATVGSFVVFITLTDCIGPNRPTYLVDLVVAKMKRCCKKCRRDSENSKLATDSSEESFSNVDSGGEIDGRRSSLYSDLDSMKWEGRRESLYSDLDSMRQSTNGAAADTELEGRRTSLYSDLENL